MQFLTRGLYFQWLKNNNPKKYKAGILAWRKANPECVRESTRLRVARFRARKG